MPKKRVAIVTPDDEDDFAPSTPVDRRTRLPDAERGATRTKLPDGTVLVSYDADQPRS
jgi:hypothetical protein